MMLSGQLLLVMSKKDISFHVNGVALINKFEIVPLNVFAGTNICH